MIIMKEEIVMKNVTLNNGVEMPLIGYGTYQIPGRKTTEYVLRAIRAGYRLIDTAQYYGNEAGVGEAIRESGLPRANFFVTTKVQTSGYEATKQGLDQSLQRFNGDYFDLVLIHWPTGDDLATYRALEEAYQEGKTRAIGLSNFNAPQVQSIIDNASVKPVIDQIETHLCWQQKRMAHFLRDHQLVHEAYAPLGEGQLGMLDLPILKTIGQKYGKTPAQVTLRFLVQEGIVVIPKTLSANHLVDNLNIFDFALSAAEMTALQALDQHQAIDGWPESMNENNY